MRRVRQILLVTVVNVIGILAVFGLLVVVPLFVQHVYPKLRTAIAVSGPVEAGLPNYRDISWSDTHFRELRRLVFEYRDYVVWRRKPFSGETINIDDRGYRVTRQAEHASNSQKRYTFFGGSTMWGVGVDDARTIPSVFAERYGVEVANFAEAGYNARQSLALLVNLYLTGEMHGKRNVVVFYDGANDVYTACRTEVTGIETAGEDQMQDIVKTAGSWRQPFSPALKLVKSMRGEPSSLELPNLFKCATNPERARAAAMLLIDTWRIAASVAESHGDTFIAILHPVSYIGAPNIEHLSIASSALYGQRKVEFEATYPFMEKLAEEHLGQRFLNFSRAYDGEEILYIDAVHVSPQAHIRLGKWFDRYPDTFGLPMERGSGG